MKGQRRLLSLVLLIALCCSLAATLTACGGYEVELPIGDGNKENDAVICRYTLDEVLTDNYELKGSFSAESEADLSGKFVFSLSFDKRFASTFSETVLFEFEGSEITQQNGKLNFTVNFGTLTNLFDRTDTDTPFYLHFHRADAERTDVTAWSVSSYTYRFDGDRIRVGQD